MNIVLITNLYPSYKEDPVTSFALHDFVKVWIQTENVFILKTKFYPTKISNKEVTDKFGNFELDKVKGRLVHIFKLPKLYSFIHNLTKVLKKESKQASLVISHLPVNHILAYTYAKEMKKPLLLGVHMSDIKLLESNTFFNRRYQQKLDKVYKECDFIACRSKAIKLRFLKIYPELEGKTDIAYSGIDESIILSEKKFLEKQKKIYTKKVFKITTVARLIPLKNIQMVLLALSKLPASFQWKYMIVGDGIEAQSLKNLALRLKIENNVNFVGTLEKSKVYEVLENTDIFVMVSAPETLGLVYLEAMALGCIVIGTKNWGIDGIIQNNDNGFLVEEENTQELTDVLTYILTPENKEEVINILENSYKTIPEYTTEKAGKNYLRIIKKVLNNAS